MEHLGTVIQCEANDTIYHYREQVRYWYQVVTGAARKCALTVDGHRQIVDFLVPGDLFGFGVRDDTHQFSTEAIARGTIIARYPRNSAEQLAEDDPQAGRWIREMVFESISRIQTRTLILGLPSSLARVSAFLLDWTDRCRPSPPNGVMLPMSRYDIADYLAMAVETVSRALTVLREREMIVLCGTRQLRICDRHALEQITEGSVAMNIEPESFHRPIENDELAKPPRNFC